MEFVAIKVKILSGAGKCLYPDFNQLSVVSQSGMDWSQYIDANGGGWKYDKKCGHADVDAVSPAGIWWGLLLIPEVFALEAIAQFPDRITRLTEVEFEEFHDGRCTCKLPDEEIDTVVLEGIKLKQDLGLPLTADQAKAIDPEDDAPGIRVNKKKYWKDVKVTKDLTIKDPE